MLWNLWHFKQTTWWLACVDYYVISSWLHIGTLSMMMTTFLPRNNTAVALSFQWEIKSLAWSLSLLGKEWRSEWDPVERQASCPGVQEGGVVQEEEERRRSHKKLLGPSLKFEYLVVQYKKRCNYKKYVFLANLRVLLFTCFSSEYYSERLPLVGFAAQESCRHNN